MAHYLVPLHEQRVLFIFSPKCGCQTIRTWLMSAMGVDDPEHSTIGAYMVSPEQAAELKDYRTVMFIRDPRRRLVSFYAHWVVRNEITWCFADAAQRFSLRGKSFRQFVFVLDHLARQGKPLQHHLLAQSAGTEALTIDELAPVERLGEELERLNSAHGLDGLIRHHNATRYRGAGDARAMDKRPSWLRKNGVPPWQAFFDEELEALVRKIYPEDTEYFDSVVLT